MGRYKLISYKEAVNGDPYVKLEADNLQFTSQAYHESVNCKGMNYQSPVVLNYDSKNDEILNLYNKTLKVKEVEDAMKGKKTGKAVLIEIKKTCGDFHPVTKVLRLAVTGKIKDPNKPNKKNAGSGGLASLFAKKN